MKRPAAGRRGHRRERRLRPRFWSAAIASAMAFGVAALVMLPVAQAAGPATVFDGPAGHQAEAPAPSGLAQVACFQQTGFCIDHAPFQSYFNARGGVDTFGYPIGRAVRLLGCMTQFFQRQLLQQCAGTGVRTMNLLDPDLMPFNQINFSVFPAHDPTIAGAAPPPTTPNYGRAILDHLRATAPETFQGLPVRFFSTFMTTAQAAPGVNVTTNPELAAQIALEIWGFPTSRPAFDPGNHNFVYQRFQRGIMHFDAASGTTRGILLADWFKSIVTARNLPADLRAQAAGNRFLAQYCPGATRALCRPSDLPESDFTDGFGGRPILTIPGDVLSQLSGTLRTYGLTPADVNLTKTVTAALPSMAMADPRVNAIATMVAPLVAPPSQDAGDLMTSERGVPVGALSTSRELRWSDRQVTPLQAGMYLVVVRRGLVVMLDRAGAEISHPSMRANVRSLTRRVTTPETIMTIRDLCFSWNQVQVCLDLSPATAFTTAEREWMTGTMRDSVRALAARGLLSEADINVEGALPDAEGQAAIRQRQATLLAAPASRFPSERGDEPVHGALLGVIHALVDIEVPGYPVVPAGVYAVRAEQVSANEWRGRLQRTDGRTVEIPAMFLEVRGRPGAPSPGAAPVVADPPMVILLNLRMVLCFFEC